MTDKSQNIVGYCHRYSGVGTCSDRQFCLTEYCWGCLLAATAEKDATIAELRAENARLSNLIEGLSAKKMECGHDDDFWDDEMEVCVMCKSIFWEATAKAAVALNSSLLRRVETLENFLNAQRISLDCDQVETIGEAICRIKSENARLRELIPPLPDVWCDQMNDQDIGRMNYDTGIKGKQLMEHWNKEECGE